MFKLQINKFPLSLKDTISGANVCKCVCGNGELCEEPGDNPQQLSWVWDCWHSKMLLHKVKKFKSSESYRSSWNPEKVRIWKRNSLPRENKNFFWIKFCREQKVEVISVDRTKLKRAFVRFSKIILQPQSDSTMFIFCTLSREAIKNPDNIRVVQTPPSSRFAQLCSRFF